jgi:hypothetical protein
MMRFRLVATALVLAGFLAINLFYNDRGQSRILEDLDTPSEVGAGETGHDPRLAGEIETMGSLRVLLDTLDALGVQVESAVNLRNEYRANIDHLERLRISYFLSQVLWRQTLANLIWGVVAALLLLPLGGLLDRRWLFQPVPVSDLENEGEEESPAASIPAPQS